ncbi:hypothetical protein ABIB68_008308 [Bradyrhizobium sp. F1.2.2]
MIEAHAFDQHAIHPEVIDRQQPLDFGCASTAERNLAAICPVQ